MNLKKHLIALGLVAVSVLQPIVGLAAGDSYIVQSGDLMTSLTRADKVVTQPFSAKGPDELAELTADERGLIDELEKQLGEEINLDARSLPEAAIRNALAKVAFDVAFDRNNPAFGYAFQIGSLFVDIQPGDVSLADLGEYSTKQLQVLEEVTNKQIFIKSKVFDRKSDTTVLVHHGYRSKGEDMLPQAKFFLDQGYNVILPDARGHGESEGQYLTFGHYEKNDVTKWIEDEVKAKPQQKIYLYGGSMGAATVMMSQETPHPNVKAVIEDCGFATLDQQFREVLGLLTNYFQYIPLVNLIDWRQKETDLIETINEKHIKPKLKMTLQDVSPLTSVSKSGLPFLFIHGEADWFINKIASEQLYNAAIGYKEHLYVPNAGHGEAFQVGGPLFTNKVTSFIESVEQMVALPPVVVPDQNLLQNPQFDFTATGFTNWLTGTSLSGLSDQPLGRNNYGEFVVQKSGSTDLLTAVQLNGGVRFFTRKADPTLYMAQNVALQKNETYEFSFTVQNMSGANLTYPAIHYGFGSELTKENLKKKTSQRKSSLYQAPVEGETAIVLGAKNGYYSWIDLNFSHTQVTNPALVNTDRTPPAAIQIEAFLPNGHQVTIKGAGEPETMMVVNDAAKQLVVKVPTDDKGMFTVQLTGQKGETYHLVNEDKKGNQSASKVIVFQ